MLIDADTMPLHFPLKLAGTLADAICNNVGNVKFHPTPIVNKKKIACIQKISINVYTAIPVVNNTHDIIAVRGAPILLIRNLTPNSEKWYYDEGEECYNRL